MSRRRVKRPQPTTDRRSPEERLEALVREPNPERAERMVERIREDLDVAPQPAPWIAGARALGERLIVSENSFYYLVALLTECLVLPASETDAELTRLAAAMQGVERANGLRDDEYWHVEDAPEEWQVLNAEWNRRADDIVCSYLRSTGNDDVAELWQKDPDDFSRRTEEGRIALWGEDEDEDASDL